MVRHLHDTRAGDHPPYECPYCPHLAYNRLDLLCMYVQMHALNACLRTILQRA